jgi:hypothetical protein
MVTSSVTGVDDAGWHTATCWRAGSQVGVTVDEVTTASTGSVGDLSNSRQLTIGAKSVTSSSDQFIGDIDYFAFATGDGAAALTQRGAGQ